MNQLKAPEASERTWACAAISSMIQNDPATRRLFQSKNVVGALIERLTDNIDEVIVEASGALRCVIRFPPELDFYSPGIWQLMAATNSAERCSTRG